jgi:hypothetical protein
MSPLSGRKSTYRPVQIPAASSDPRVLNLGDGFFEPAGHTMLKFDNASDAAPPEIVCYYLMDDDKRPAIEMLEGGMDAQLGKGR